MSPSPPFSILYADPPWLYATARYDGSPPDRKDRPNLVPPPPYPCLPTSVIAALPVQSLCAEDCVLFLWTVYAMLPDALRVIAAWGFHYRTCAFTWVKQNPKGVGFSFGTGYWTRANPELCLLATRGRPHRVSNSVPNLLIAPRRDHSRKPAEVRERIVSICGDLPRLELFAREKTPGWSVWGNEVENDIALRTEEETRSLLAWQTREERIDRPLVVEQAPR